MPEKFRYALSGAMPVTEEFEPDDMETVRRHLKGIAEVYLAHDTIAQTVSLRIGGMLAYEDIGFIERRIERFAERYSPVGAILVTECNDISGRLLVGHNWDVQCLITLGATKEALEKLTDPNFEFLVRLEQPDGNPPQPRPVIRCDAIDAHE
ncbi:hypothetical protein B2G74_13685 [Burkholderia sp. A27]|nr:hypothetical protein B2G74_13685 [Burkholderia sp. A27]